jgi:hypothetical protein
MRSPRALFFARPSLCVLPRVANGRGLTAAYRADARGSLDRRDRENAGELSRHSGTFARRLCLPLTRSSVPQDMFNVVTHVLQSVCPALLRHDAVGSFAPAGRCPTGALTRVVQLSHRDRKRLFELAAAFLRRSCPLALADPSREQRLAALFGKTAGGEKLWAAVVESVCQALVRTAAQLLVVSTRAPAPRAAAAPCTWEVYARLTRVSSPRAAR